MIPKAIGNCIISNLMYFPIFKFATKFERWKNCLSYHFTNKILQKQKKKTLEKQNKMLDELHMVNKW